MLNLINDCRDLARLLIVLRRRKEELQNEISDREKSLALLLFQIEGIRSAESRPNSANHTTSINGKGEG